MLPKKYLFGSEKRKKRKKNTKWRVKFSMMVYIYML